MAVRIITRNSLEATEVPGTLVTLTQQMGIAEANGASFVIVENTRENNVAIRLENITVMEEYDDDSSIYG